MKDRILITGGAGFIGRYLARSLLERGYKVRVLDALIGQVHAGSSARAVGPDIDFVRGDVRDSEVVGRVIKGCDGVIHLAAEVGVGQSMYEIARYVGANDLGTGVLFDALIRKPVRRVVVASSMSIYGEGLYRDADGNLLDTIERNGVSAGDWDPRGPSGEPLTPVATPEWKRPALASVYALTKYAQERLTLTVAPAFGMEACALRLFNVFGAGQALSNPYTGVLAIFASRFLNRQRPLVFEDGRQRRDFVHVEDVAEAFARAYESEAAAGQVFNIASGRDYTVLDIARILAVAMGRPRLKPEVMNKARTGDIRHCFADIGHARTALGYEPSRFIEDSVDELAAWAGGQRADDRVEHARAELEQWGLVA